MKRLLGLLLALSLLFSFALGEESTRWTVSCSADASTAAQVLTGLGVGETDASAVAKVLSTVCTAVSGIRLVMQTREGSARYALVWGEEELFFCTVTKQSDGSRLIASSLWPGYSVCVSGAEAADPSLIELQSELQSAVQGWAAYRLTAAEETGVFAGETYTGGDRKATVTLTDRDLVDLVESLILVLEEHNEVLYGADGADAAAEIWHGLRAVNQQIRNENRFSYTFHRVWQKDRLIGLSLTIRDGTAIEWMLSAGREEDDTIRFAATAFAPLTALTRGTLVRGTDTSTLTLREYLAAPGAELADAADGLVLAVTELSIVREAAEPFAIEEGTVITAEDAAEDEGYAAAVSLGATSLALGLMRHMPEGMLPQLLKLLTPSGVE